MINATTTGAPEVQAQVTENRQLDVNDAAQVPAEETKQAQDPMSSKFAALARKEKAILEMQRQMKAEKEALEAERRKYETDYIPKSRLKEDPFTAFNEAGLTYDEITKKILEEGNPEQYSLQSVKQELQRIKEEQEATKKLVTESQTKAYQQALKQLEVDARDLIEREPEFEILKDTERYADVVKKIEDYYQENGVVLSVEKAAREVKTELLEEIKRFTGLKSVQSILKPEAPAMVQTAEKPQTQEKQQQPLKTLTHAVAASGSKPLTAKERRERAIAAFKGQLTS